MKCLAIVFRRKFELWPEQVADESLLTAQSPPFRNRFNWRVQLRFREGVAAISSRHAEQHRQNRFSWRSGSFDHVLNGFSGDGRSSQRRVVFAKTFDGSGACCGGSFSEADIVVSEGIGGAQLEPDLHKLWERQERRKLNEEEFRGAAIDAFGYCNERSRRKRIGVQVGVRNVCSKARTPVVDQEIYGLSFKNGELPNELSRQLLA